MNIETNTEMKRVLVTGAAGFIGHALVQRLLGEGLGGRAVDQVIAMDLKFDAQSADPRVVHIEGSIADADVRKRALAAPPDAVFHLAALMGSAAERDYELGRRVNLDATLGLIEDLRGSAVPPRVVFASSVAVYGRLPKHADENVLPAPPVTYGAQKLVGEILLADASRRGWMQGCSLRLPGVVARPSEGPGMFTAFMSHLFWRLAAGQPMTVPVSPSGKVWWISVGACVDNLLYAACVEPERLNGRRDCGVGATRTDAGNECPSTDFRSSGFFFPTRASGDWLCHSNLPPSVPQPPAALIRSATISAIKMTVGLVATDGTSGMIEASPA